MRIGQSSPLCLFAFGCLLLACLTILSEHTTVHSAVQPRVAKSQQAEGQAVENVGRAEREIEQAQEQAKDGDKAKADAVALRKAADAARKKAEELRAQTLAAGRNPDDPQDAPITYRATQNWKAAEARAAEAEQNLSDPPGALTSPMPEPEGRFKTYLALVVGVVLAGSLFIYSVYSMNRMLRERSAKLISQGAGAQPRSGKPVTLKVTAASARAAELDDLRRRLEKADRRVSEALKLGGEAQRRITDLEARLKELENSVGSAMRVSPGVPPHAAAASPPAGQRVAAARAGSTILQEEVVTRELTLTFPVTVTDCLSTLREAQAKTLTLKAVSLHGGLLVKAERGEFLLVEDDRPAHPLLLIPGIERFVTKQDFYNNYDDFYHCPKVTSGEVWIVSPAIVEEVPEGWQLRLKGELKV
jgi:hypothetical protein